MRDIEFRGIYDTFAHTEYGERLQDTIRYEKYNLGGLSNDEWCELLGKDANNLYHMEATYELAGRFVDSQNSSDKAPINSASTALLLLSSIIHDQAEAIVGDVSYGDKMPTDETREINEFEIHLDAMNPNMNHSVRAMAKSAIKGVIFNPSTSEGALFNAVERTGYLVTALHAANKLPTVTNTKTADGLYWLIADVFLNQIPALVEYTHKYQLPYELLAENAESISTFFATMPEAIFNYYKENGPQKQENFIKAQQTWATFCSQHGL